MTRIAVVAVALLTVSCGPLRGSCGIGTTHTDFGPGVYQGPTAENPISAVAGGDPILCRGILDF